MYLVKKAESFPVKRDRRVVKVSIKGVKVLLGRKYLHVTYTDDNGQLRGELVGETAQKTRLFKSKEGILL